MTNAAVKKPLPGELVKAVQSNDVKAVYEQVQDLLQRGAAVNEDFEGCTALIAAATLGYPEVARLLIDNGADVNQKTVRGVTPLVEAARTNHMEVARLLLDRGAEIDATNDYKATALIYAASANAKETARLLIDKGADLSITNRSGKTALSVAQMFSLDEMTQLLTEASERRRELAEEEAANAAHITAVQKQNRLKSFMLPSRRLQP
jgi:ankyrin repeat protein